jgi:hypothetical protein
VFDGKRLCDAEDERAREMCTGGLMFVAAEDNVVFIEPKPNVKSAPVGLRHLMDSLAD